MLVGLNVMAQDPSGGLVIEPTELPGTYPQGPYEVRMHARGNYVPVLRWKVSGGALPPGITLAEDGTLRGAAQRTGEFQFTLAVKDGGQPQQALQRSYTIKVVEAIMVAWKSPAHVNGNRIEGSVQVSNTTVDDIDLTFDVKAVAENGRATEIGYQHFPLKRGTLEMALPFGETLPNGGYVVNVSVVGEIARRNAIYREQLQMPGALQVAVTP
jgi:Putative Ig domain